jgi:CRISPR-associated protein Cmr6
MNRNSQPAKSKSPADIWREFVQAELKIQSKLGKLLELSVYGGYENKSLTVYFADDTARKTAQGQREAIQKKLKDQYRLLCDRISFVTGSISATPKPASVANNTSKPANPLQALCWVEPNLPDEGDEAQRMQILNAAVEAEKACQPIYAKLKQRTLKLAGSEANTINLAFNWRVRIGGTRGFRELLLPVLHPIFGIPYIPASTLKGAASAWAKKHGASAQVYELLGMLQGKDAKAAKVEFLDAFPTKHCLSVDVATPQWSWNSDVVKYQPVPHPLLSLYQPEFLIGLRPTTRTKDDQDAVQTVKQWLENALAEGIGSRVSSGYGRASLPLTSSNTRHSYEFQLWTQGMYGNNPPSKENNYQGSVEFRPTAVRGILRYWFRAVALALYDVPTCQILETQLFGKLGQQGNISVNTKFNSSAMKEPYCYTGRVYLEATEDKYLNLAKQLLILASHLGGVGRGSRRPLHLLNGRMRGCHWEISDNNLPFAYDAAQWRNFFTELKLSFQLVQSPINSYISNPGTPNQRHQDVLDSNTQVWLVNSPAQIQPQQIKDWQEKGSHTLVKGAALNLLYDDERFKGERYIKDTTGKRIKMGNPNVGGALGTPSYVWIKSIFYDNSAYQVVTIFGCKHPERGVFAQELEKLKKQNHAILVFGEMPNNNQPLKPAPLRRKQ